MLSQSLCCGYRAALGLPAPQVGQMNGPLLQREQPEEMDGDINLWRIYNTHHTGRLTQATILRGRNSTHTQSLKMRLWPSGPLIPTHLSHRLFWVIRGIVYTVVHHWCSTAGMQTVCILLPVMPLSVPHDLCLNTLFSSGWLVITTQWWLKALIINGIIISKYLSVKATFGIPSLKDAMTVHNWPVLGICVEELLIYSENTLSTA